MPKTYVTQQNETVDLACWKHYRRTKDVTELVLATNPGLAELGPVLPFATTITMPDDETKKRQTELVSLGF